MELKKVKNKTLNEWNTSYVIKSICDYQWGEFGGARGVMVIVVGNGHGDSSSNPRRG